MAIMIVKGVVEAVGRKPHLSGVAVKIRDSHSGILFDVIVDEDDGVVEGEKVSASGEVVWLDALHMSHLVCSNLARKGDQKIAHRKPRFVDQSPVPARSSRQRSEAVEPSRERQDSAPARSEKPGPHHEEQASSRKPAGRKSRSTRPASSGGTDVKVKPDIESLDVSAFQFKRNVTDGDSAQSDDVPKASAPIYSAEQVQVNEFAVDESEDGGMEDPPPPMSEDESALIMQRMNNDNW
ncbi:hypothetical protein ACP3V3_02020 [Vibrio sp. PNB22_3_1]